MRFDDMIATVLSQHEESGPAALAKWRQLVDLIAQRRNPDTDGRVNQAYSWLRQKRSGISFAVREEAARSLSGRRVTPAIIAFFAEDVPAIAAPLISGALLDAGQWLELLPKMNPVARALLRHRRDLAPEISHALGSFGASDFALSGPVHEAHAKTAPERNSAQIRELVAKIEAFRKDRPQPFPVATGLLRAESFHWEAAGDGIIIWVEDAPRGPLIGQSIAATAEHGQFGVDGQAAGAFEKRAPFRDARFTVAGTGVASGDWRISGVPFFDPTHGNFLGYRGSARRPRLDEVARPDPTAAPAGLFGTDLPADSLRQLIHELRTPLNAIVGFAEMIEGQYMGPAADSYRFRAAEIMEQATRLLSAVDDLDTAARIETSRLTLDHSSVDAVALLWRLHEAYERIARQRNVHISVEVAPDLPQAKVELGVAERMFARMLAATIGLAQQDETIVAVMAMGQIGNHEMLCLSIDRPKAIEGLDEHSLLDPGYSPDGDWPGAPALGLGFALRLVRNLAEAVGGALLIGTSRFILYLPPLDSVERSSGQLG